MKDEVLKKRIEDLEKEVKALKKLFNETDKRDGEETIEMNLTLPEADIDGLRFNETKVRAVFERKEDGWYYSRDILFLSARNVEDDNSRDILTEYLNLTEKDLRFKSRFVSSLKDAIADAVKDALNLETIPMIEISLPTENEGIKRYNGVDWWYWQRQSYAGSSAYFCYVGTGGFASGNNASSVGGCAPAFRVAV